MRAFQILLCGSKYLLFWKVRVFSVRTGNTTGCSAFHVFWVYQNPVALHKYFRNDKFMKNQLKSLPRLLKLQGLLLNVEEISKEKSTSSTNGTASHEQTLRRAVVAPKQSSVECF